MKLPIEKHIFELLKHHDCVIITGLGGFILNYRNAYINKITNQIHPPSKEVSFNKNLCKNDGLLANHLTSVENLSYDEACLEIMRFFSFYFTLISSTFSYNSSSSPLEYVTCSQTTFLLLSNKKVCGIGLTPIFVANSLLLS